MTTQRSWLRIPAARLHPLRPATLLGAFVLSTLTAACVSPPTFDRREMNATPLSGESYGDCLAQCNTEGNQRHDDCVHTEQQCELDCEKDGGAASACEPPCQTALTSCLDGVTAFGQMCAASCADAGQADSGDADGPTFEVDVVDDGGGDDVDPTACDNTEKAATGPAAPPSR